MQCDICTMSGFAVTELYLKQMHTKKNEVCKTIRLTFIKMCFPGVHPSNLTSHSV
jgi:hypothetical protein